jgi:16S rRNA (uracil1498-N3)-methyltransferase
VPRPRARLLVRQLPAAGTAVRLTREEAAHARARRLRAGDSVLLFDGSGAEALGVLAKLDRSGAEVVVESVLPARDAAPGLALLVAGLRAERLSWLAEKATELSVERFTIVQTARTQSFRASPDSLARLARVAREAAKQCEAARWPKIAGPVPFEAAIAEGPASHRLFLEAGGESFPRSLSARPVVLFVGPEGGWTDDERGAARAAGWSAVALPAGKLRAETAAIGALVLARAALGRKT